jgi:WD40 repeat protein
MWDAEIGEAVGQPVQGYEDWVYCVTFSPGGSYLAFGSRDNTIWI